MIETITIMMSHMSINREIDSRVFEEIGVARSQATPQAVYLTLVAAVPSLVPRLVNSEPRLVPTELAPAMMPTEMRAAIRPYSIAVAPDSSLRKRVKRVVMFCIPVEALLLTRFR